VTWIYSATPPVPLSLLAVCCTICVLTSIEMFIFLFLFYSDRYRWELGRSCCY